MPNPETTTTGYRAIADARRSAEQKMGTLREVIEARARPGEDVVDTVGIVRSRLADGRTIADTDVHRLVAEIDRLRAALERVRYPTPGMRLIVGADWGRRTWRQYAEVIAEALQHG